MNKLNIEVGDSIEFKNICFSDKRVVVSEKFQHCMQYYQKVTYVSEDYIKIEDFDDEIPMDWVKSIAWKGFSKDEENRKSLIEAEFDKERAGNSIYNKALRITGVSTVILFTIFIFSIVVGCVTSWRIPTVITLFTSLILSLVPSVIFLANESEIDDKSTNTITKNIYSRIPFTYQEACRFKLHCDYEFLKKVQGIVGDIDYDVIIAYRNSRIKY